MDIREDYLKRIDEVIAAGPYKDDWASLSKYPVPEWYKDAKFGIFIHWGVYCVPAFASEWYPMLMYHKETEAYKHHIETYGPHKEFGYKDFIPMFKAEKFDAEAWADLFEEAGAKYIMPVCEHHDGFQMYDSELSEFCAAKMGPCRDIAGEIKRAVEKRGMTFCASSHRAENFWFYNGCREFDSGLQEIEFQEPYGWASPTVTPADTNNIHGPGPSEAHMREWLIRTCEIIDKYQPKIVWFDWWIQNAAWKPYLKKLAAYYYNRSVEWGCGVAINYKFDAYAYGTAVFDIERGQLSGASERLWQNDTAIAKNSWGYTENNDFKRAEDLICDLVDIVSKNGCLLLNIGPKKDGTITDEETAVLRSIGAWLKVNGEGIYGSRPFEIWGEGPTEVPEGSFTDVNRTAFTAEDIRFTWKAPYLYAYVLSWPENGEIAIKSLRDSGIRMEPPIKTQCFHGDVLGAEILGSDVPVSYERKGDALYLKAEGIKGEGKPVCVRFKLD